MGDPLERMRVYQLAKALLKPAFSDGEILREIQRMLKAIIPRERVRLIRPKREPT